MLFPSHSSNHSDGAVRKVFAKLIRRLRTTVETRIGIATVVCPIGTVVTYTSGTNKGVHPYVYGIGNVDYAGVSETVGQLNGPCIVRYSGRAMVRFDAASDADPPVGGDLVDVSSTTDGCASTIPAANNFIVGQVLDGSMYSPTNRYGLVQLRHCNQRYNGPQ